MTGEVLGIKKSAEKPFVFSGTCVQSGEAKLLVTYLYVLNYIVIYLILFFVFVCEGVGSWYTIAMGHFADGASWQSDR